MTKSTTFALAMLISLIMPLVSVAQPNFDSLLETWQDSSQSDSARATAYSDYIEKVYLYSHRDSTILKAEELIQFSKTNNYPIAAGQGLRLKGIANAMMSNYEESEMAFTSALKKFEEGGDEIGVAHCLKNIGRVKNYQGKPSEAVDYVKRAMSIFENYDDKKGILGCLNVLGELYYQLNDTEMLLQYAENALEISEELNDKREIAGSLANLGSIYWQQKEFDKSIEFTERSLKLKEELGDMMGMASSRSNLGSSYLQLGKTELAMENAKTALDLYKKMGLKNKVAQLQKDIGIIYGSQDDFDTALEYCNSSFEIAQEIGDIRLEEDVCTTLYKIHKKLGKSDKALFYFERRQEILDSLNSIDAAKKLQKMEFEKIMLQDSIVKAEEARLVEEAYQEEIRQKNQTRNWTAAGGLFALLLAAGFYSRWRYVRKSRDLISKEKDRSENLLLNILPAEIAKELKEKGRADARDFDRASILFTDFKEFTATSEKLTAKELVTEINTCFEAFDGIINKHKIEKIKTIGDAYMAAGGLPVPSKDSAKRTVLAALDMQEFVSKRKAQLDSEGKPGFEMRVGIHTGPVVAGIVGVKKFQYDVWGDTVNTASRMESSGEVGKVNISESTYNLIKDDPEFVFESRGQLEAKGKGMMNMYFVMKT